MKHFINQSTQYNNEHRSPTVYHIRYRHFAFVACVMLQELG